MLFFRFDLDLRNQNTFNSKNKVRNYRFNYYLSIYLLSLFLAIPIEGL